MCRCCTCVCDECVVQEVRGHGVHSVYGVMVSDVCMCGEYFDVMLCVGKYEVFQSSYVLCIVLSIYGA